MTRTGLAVPEEPDDPTGPHECGWEKSLGSVTYGPLSHRIVTIANKSSRPVENIAVLLAESKADFAIVEELHSTITKDLFAEEIRKSLVSAEPRKRARHARVSPQKLTRVAVLIAGRERPAVQDEWRSHLSGEAGAGLPADRQVRAAAGFVLAAIRFRLQDIAEAVWRRVDALLASRLLSNLFVLAPTLGMAVAFLRHGGLYNAAVNFQNIGAVWVAAYALVRTGRWWREVKPPERKPRRTSD